MNRRASSHRSNYLRLKAVFTKIAFLDTFFKGKAIFEIASSFRDECLADQRFWATLAQNQDI